jgi:hypothetical protein
MMMAYVGLLEVRDNGILEGRCVGGEPVNGLATEGALREGVVTCSAQPPRAAEAQRVAAAHHRHAHSAIHANVAHGIRCGVLGAGGPRGVGKRAIREVQPAATRRQPCR